MNAAKARLKLTGQPVQQLRPKRPQSQVTVKAPSPKF